MAEKETKRDHQKAILAILRCIKSRPQFFAEQLQKSMKVGELVLFYLNNTYF